MNSVERVKKICKERKIPISKLEKDVGFANGYIGQLKKGTFPDVRLALIAEYLGVSTQYLLTGEEKPAPKWDEMETIVDRIRLLSKQKNTSITKIEEKLGYANGTIGKWAKAKRRPPLEKVIAIARELDTTAEYLLTGEQKKEPAHEGEPGNIGPNMKALLESIKDLSETEAALVSDRIKKIKESR